MTLNYSVVFEFERQYDDHTFWEWMKENWTLCYVYSAVYVVLIFGGKWVMARRPRYDLRPYLALWSAMLAIFSICGTLRMWTELIYSVTNYSLQYAMCVPSYYTREVAGFWSFLFVVSKVVELGDTVFIVLRKTPLIFLHWYHHITVLIYVWATYTEHAASGRMFCTMNYTVHSFMYTYYALRALRYNIPKWVNIMITLMQLLQMVIGVVINIWVYQIKSRGEPCQQSWDNLKYAFLMYFSYFVLFANFFYNAYLKKPLHHHEQKKQH
ncbi:putative fatty acid elongation protein 3 [Lingula anatina]|uniref:Elongation of very long chain fatty acids protein n=1 Tax=Lingula anatina TaxID=7574 RepID=A0A1S3GZ13_LINAN|nr:putative fatty acid elongation protein 3 [Lingula anatina]|eukprot:XP_013379110.1 putative fatty acid elongation protein 3 [Lingula anatina]